MSKRVRAIAAIIAMGLVCGGSMINSNAASVEAEMVDVITNEDVIDINLGEADMLAQVSENSNQVDNSQFVYFPPIINQGTINSCSSWAVTYYQASYEFNRIDGKDGSLPCNQLSPMWTYNLTNGGKNEGTYYTDVVKVLKNVGAINMEKLPVDTTTGDMNIGDITAYADIWREANAMRIKGAVTVFDGDANRIDNTTPITSEDDEDLDEIKDALRRGHILSASTPGNKWKYTTIKLNSKVPGNDKYAGEKIVSRCDAEGYMGHRIVIVGFNDEIWCDVNENDVVDNGEMGAFKIANSRGVEYGNDGYMWIAYDSLNIISACYENSQIDLGFENREPSLIDLVYLEVEKERELSNCSVEFKATTSSCKGMSVVITATNKEDNNLSVYKVVPFKSALDIGLGDVSFDGSNNENTGSFSIPLDNMFENISVEDLDKYVWHIKVANSNSKNVVTYSDIKIVDVNGSAIYRTDLASITIDNTEEYIKFEKIM